KACVISSPRSVQTAPGATMMMMFIPATMPPGPLLTACATTSSTAGSRDFPEPLPARRAFSLQSQCMFADRTQWNLSANRLAEALARHRASRRKLLDLTASNPTECGIGYDERAILGALSHPQALHYRPDPSGLLSAREAVREYYAARGEAEVTAEQILL